MKLPATKYCAHCGQTLPVKRFRTVRKSVGGPPILRYICRGCERVYQREYLGRKTEGPLPPERDEFKPIKPWPWPAGTKVFA